MKAAVFSTDLAPAVLQQLADVLEEVGLEEVLRFGAGPYPPEPLKRMGLVLLDEWVGGRSAFEIHTLLTASYTERPAALVLLVEPPVQDLTRAAARCAGFERCLTKPVDREALREFARWLFPALSPVWLPRGPLRSLLLRIVRPHRPGRIRWPAPLPPAAPVSEPGKALAAMITTDLEPAALASLEEALWEAGFDGVTHVGDLDQLFQRQRKGSRTVGAGAALRGKRFVLLDERLAGRSAFEIHALLRATPDLREAKFGVLLSGPVTPSTIDALSLAGFSFYHVKPADPGQLRRFARCLRAALRHEEFPGRSTRTTPPRGPMGAAVIASGLDPDFLRRLERGFRAEGFGDFVCFESVAEVIVPTDGGSNGWGPAERLRGKQVIIFGEWVGEFSGLAMHTVLRAFPESRDCADILLLPPSAPDRLVMVAHAVNIDACLSMPRNAREQDTFVREITTFARRICQSIPGVATSPSEEVL